MTKITVEHYGVAGQGRTVTEAKQDAGRKITRIMAHLSPKMYAYRGHAVVIYPNTEGTSYSLIHDDSNGPIHSSCSCASDDAEESAIRHLLSITRKIGEYEIPTWVPSKMHRRLLGDWRRDDGFQLAYKHAEGLTPAELNGCDCHRWACDHSKEFEPAT